MKLLPALYEVHSSLNHLGDSSCVIMSRKASENWLLVELSGGERDVVYTRSVLSPLNKDLKVGDVLTVKRRGEAVTATLVARARERDMLDSINQREGLAGPSVKNEDEEDFSSGASSWAPSDDGVDSADEVEHKKIKLERSKRQYTGRKSNKKIMTPSHRATPVIPKIMQRANELKRKTPRLNTPINKSLPDSTKINSLKNSENVQKVAIDVRELINIKNSFQTLFKMLEDLKMPVINGVNESIKPEVPSLFEDTVQQSFNHSDEDKENEISEGEEFNRSDDNILISNKYINTNVMTVEPNDSTDKEWVPIGSGKTLIHADQFNKVNWKSYTIATRTLLLAVFPRRMLATHSLTGKRSPAFQDKPAKMCLDPKIISDVIMEIMDRFNVRENLVRSIITTKCADECKMWKTRAQKKTSKRGKARQTLDADDE